MRGFIALFLIVLASHVVQHPVYAAKLRVRKPRVIRPIGIAYSRARLSRTTNSVVVTFLNLDQVQSITYTLRYTAGGIPQGVVGTVVPSGQATESRDLYFGTCSHGVCTAHNNIHNATLVIQTTLTSGSVHTKRYRIKV